MTNFGIVATISVIFHGLFSIFVAIIPLPFAFCSVMKMVEMLQQLPSRLGLLSWLIGRKRDVYICVRLCAQVHASYQVIQCT